MGYWFITRPEISKQENINETAAIELVKNKYSDLKEYPSDQLPPKSIKTEKTADGWYVAFIQEGSGRLIIRATCFFVNNNKNVARIDEFNPNINDTALNISPKTCRTAMLSDDQTEKPVLKR